MIDDSLLNRLPDGVETRPGAVLRDYTTFRLGGACTALIECPEADMLAETAMLLHGHAVPFIVIGQGSNLLVCDAGIDAVVLRYCAEGKPAVRIQGNRIRVSGNTLLDELVQYTIGQGVGDLSFCSGIPGTVGGAIAGNAGAFGRQIGDVIESVRLLDGTGTKREASADELSFRYRSSKLRQSGEIVLDAVLNLGDEDISTMQKERARIMELRRNRHPDWRILPCAGSVFRNVEPTSAAERRQAAGWFLEQAGAKNLRVGGARLFEKHANIVIAGENSTARNVYELTEKMNGAVEEKFGFRLEREIRLLGEF